MSIGGESMNRELTFPHIPKFTGGEGGWPYRGWGGGGSNLHTMPINYFRKKTLC